MSSIYNWTQLEKIANVSVGTVSFAIILLVVIFHRALLLRARNHDLVAVSILATLLAWLIYSTCNFCLTGLLTTGTHAGSTNSKKVLRLRLSTRLMSTITIGAAQVSSCLQLGSLVSSRELDSGFTYMAGTGILTIITLTSSALTSIWISCMYTQVTFLSIENTSTMCVDSTWLWLASHIASALSVAFIACYIIFATSLITVNDRLRALPLCIPWSLGTLFAVMIYRVDKDSGTATYLQNLQTVSNMLITLYSGVRPTWIKLRGNRGNRPGWNTRQRDDRSTFYWKNDGTSHENQTRCTRQPLEDGLCLEKPRAEVHQEFLSTLGNLAALAPADIKRSAKNQLCRTLTEEDRSLTHEDHDLEDVSICDDQASIWERPESSDRVMDHTGMRGADHVRAKLSHPKGNMREIGLLRIAASNAHVKKMDNRIVCENEDNSQARI